MKKTFTLFVLAAFTSSTVSPAFARAELNFQEAYPRAEDVARSFIPPAQDGQYQIRIVGEKFAALFTSQGDPVVIFDLSLNPLSLHEVILGSIGFGDLTLRGLMRAIKKARKSTKDAQQIDSKTEEAVASLFQAEADTLSKKEEKSAFQAADRFFKKANLKPDSSGEFKSFRLSEVDFASEEMKSHSLKPFLELATILYPDKAWDLENILDFMHEFEYRYNPSIPGYDIVWNRSVRAQSPSEAAQKQPKLPGIVVNFMNPWQNLIFKYKLQDIDGQGEWLIRKYGVQGILMDLVLSRIVHGLTERLDYHERQLIGLLEAAERFEYLPNLPPRFVDVTLDLLYLNRFTNPGDPYLVDGPMKRRVVRAMQQLNHPKALASLRKLSEKKKLTIEEFGGGKFALVRDAEFRGIYSLGMGPAKFSKKPILHVNGGGSGRKLAERYFVDIAGFLARALIPGWFVIRFKLGGANVGIGGRIPPSEYDSMIRARMVAELELEGELSSLVDEAIAGRISLPMSQTELLSVQRHLRQTQLNPYKLGFEEEKQVIQKNRELLERLIEGESPSAVLTTENMVPFVM